MNTYENALKQLDEIIDYLHKHQSADCAAAETEDLALTRFQMLKRVLSPKDQTSIDKIAAYHAKLPLR